MTKEEYQNLIKQIGQCEDDAQRRELLVTLEEGTTPVFDDVASLTERNKNLTDDNEALRSANMKLFLRVGGRTEEDVRKDEHNEEPKKLKFEDLFNEKGGLK
jgi:predicted double-glycine peptidase